MKIQIENQNDRELDGWCLVPQQASTAEENVREIVIDYIEDDIGGAGISSFKLTEHEENPRCFNFFATLMTEGEARQEHADALRDSLEDR